MTDKVDTSRAIVLRGRLQNYRSERSTGDFLLSDIDRQSSGLAAVASALAGSGGAVGLASMAGTQEVMNKVQFEVDGKHVSGWLSWSIFKGGDDVEVVAEPLNNGTYRVFAILRPADRLVALYPHCSRGRWAHYKASTKWFFRVVMPFYLLVCLALIGAGDGGGATMENYLYVMGGGLLGCIVVYGSIAAHIASRFMRFVRMAENIFDVLGWKNVKSIDLPARSKAQRRRGDSPGLGTLYFRY
jgi:hypothetical protein